MFWTFQKLLKNSQRFLKSFLKCQRPANITNFVSENVLKTGNNLLEAFKVILHMPEAYKSILKIVRGFSRHFLNRRSSLKSLENWQKPLQMFCTFQKLFTNCQRILKYFLKCERSANTTKSFPNITRYFWKCFGTDNNLFVRSP